MKSLEFLKLKISPKFQNYLPSFYSAIETP